MQLLVLERSKNYFELISMIHRWPGGSFVNVQRIKNTSSRIEVKLPNHSTPFLGTAQFFVLFPLEAPEIMLLKRYGQHRDLH